GPRHAAEAEASIVERDRNDRVAFSGCGRVAEPDDENVARLDRGAGLQRPAGDTLSRDGNSGCLLGRHPLVDRHRAVLIGDDLRRCATADGPGAHAVAEIAWQLRCQLHARVPGIEVVLLGTVALAFAGYSPGQFVVAKAMHTGGPATATALGELLL